MRPFDTAAALARLMLARAGAGSGAAASDARIRRLLLAARTVPYYRRQMEHAQYDPLRDFSGASDLAILGVTPKADVQADPRAFFQDGTRTEDAYFSDHTSGSTGIPLRIYRSAPERAIQVAKWLRVLLLNGYRPTHKVLSFTAPSRIPQHPGVLERAGLFRRRALSYASSPQSGADAFVQFRPDVVYGIATLILMLAEEIEARGIRTSPLTLLVAGGEVIDAQMRERCRRVFGVDLTETYGSVEMGVMAYQHRGESGLRLIEDCTHFEFVDALGNPAPPGQLARVITTDLHGRLMPFIRYDHGDLAVYSLRQNERGETVRVIERIVGREDDVALLPDGSALTYLNFVEVLGLYHGIRRWRVTQRAADAFVVELATEPAHASAIEDELAARLKGLSRVPLVFEIRCVENMSADRNGKIRKLVSEIGGNAGGRVRWTPAG